MTDPTLNRESARGELDALQARATNLVDTQNQITREMQQMNERAIFLQGVIATFDALNGSAPAGNRQQRRAAAKPRKAAAKKR